MSQPSIGEDTRSVAAVANKLPCGKDLRLVEFNRDGQPGCGGCNRSFLSVAVTSSAVICYGCNWRGDRGGNFSRSEHHELCRGEVHKESPQRIGIMLVARGACCSMEAVSRS